MTARLDHVMLGVPDLDAAGTRLAAAGVPVAAGGDHPSGTFNALAVSPRRWAYVELVAARPDAEGEVAGRIRQGGLAAYAVAVDDLDAAVRDLTAAGFACGPVVAGARTTGDGRRVQWRTAVLGPGVGASELPFLIEWPAGTGSPGSAGSPGGAPHRTGMVQDVGTADVTELEVGTRDPARFGTFLATLGLRAGPVGGVLSGSDGEVTIRAVRAEPGLRSVRLTRPDLTSVTLTPRADGPPVAAERRPRRWMRTTNFADVAAGTVALHPDRVALVADGATLTYADLDDRVARFTGLLGELDVRRGDVVALAFGNDHRFVEALLGTLRAGAVALLVNVKQGADTIDHVLRHSGATVVLGGPRATLDPAAYEDRLAAAVPVRESAPVGPDDLAILMYTSGSTGVPKGVMLSHGNTWWQARSNVRAMLHDDGDRGLVMGPLYHANALWAALFPMLYAGGGVVVLPEFDPARVLDAIERHRITYTSGTPSMYALLLAEDERSPRDVSSVELLECGSAPVPAELMARITARFACDLVETYGLTEGGATVLSPRWGAKKLGSTGLPVPEADIRVVDGAGRECAAGEVGELWTRSPANALGYRHDPGTTAERFLPDGWLRTGDLFRRDDQGYCFFCGRADDLIAVGGENVYPKEVEALLLRHPAVAEAGVVPAGHPVKGEAPVAWVVLRAGQEADEDAIRAYALAHGPAYAHPRRVFFTAALPVSGTNKLDRRALQDRTAERLPDGLTPGRRLDLPPPE